MRRILTATTALALALIGASAANAAELGVKLGGSVQFESGFFDSNKSSTSHRDFVTGSELRIDATGQADNGLQYGARMRLDDGIADKYGFLPDSGFRAKEASIFASGGWGKVQAGDHQGAITLFSGTPSVGLGQVDGDYVRFLPNVVPFIPTYFDGTDTSTKVSYYTPRVAGFQAGVSYTPRYGDQGSNVSMLKGTGGYDDVLTGVANYSNTYGNGVSAGLSGLVLAGNADNPTGLTLRRDFSAFGVGAKVGYSGFALGGTYVDAGRYGTTTGQNGDQNVWSIGGKYETGPFGVGANYLQGKGYLAQSIGFVPTGAEYTKEYKAYGLGGVYAVAPGLTVNADAVRYEQKTERATNDDKGYVFLLGSKLDF